MSHIARKISINAILELFNQRQNPKQNTDLRLPAFTRHNVVPDPGALGKRSLKPDIRILDLDWKNHGDLDISNWASLVVVTVASVYGLKLGILLNARAPVNTLFFFCKGFWADPQRSRALLWAGNQSVEPFLNQMRSVFYLLRRFCRNIHNLGIKIIPLWNPVAQTISNNLLPRLPRTGVLGPRTPGNSTCKENAFCWARSFRRCGIEIVWKLFGDLKLRVKVK